MNVLRGNSRKSRLGAVFVLFFCAGLGSVHLHAAEISNNRAAQIVDECIPQELKTSFEQAICQRSYAFAVTLYREISNLLDQTLKPLLDSLDPSSQIRLRNAKNLYPSRYATDRYSLSELHRFKTCLSRENIRSDWIEYTYDERFKKIYPRQNGRDGITRYSNGISIFIPKEEVVATDLELTDAKRIQIKRQFEEGYTLFTRREQYRRRKQYRNFKIISSIVAIASTVGGLFWWWNKS